MMIAYRRALLLLLALGDWRSAAAGQQPSASPPLDSITLERSPCFGACPAYRLRLSRGGTVVFVSRYGETIRDSIPPSALIWLRDEATRRELFTLPKIIVRDRALCPSMASDSPTVTVTLYWATRWHRIIDYLGCVTGNSPSTPLRLHVLRHFEAAIDSVARTARALRGRLPSPPPNER